MFVILRLDTELDLSLPGKSVAVQLSYEEGMIGVLPVFETLEQAKAVAGEEYQILAAHTVP